MSRLVFVDLHSKQLAPPSSFLPRRETLISSVTFHRRVAILFNADSPLPPPTALTLTTAYSIIVLQ